MIIVGLTKAVASRLHVNGVEYRILVHRFSAHPLSARTARILLVDWCSPSFEYIERVTLIGNPSGYGLRR